MSLIFSPRERLPLIVPLYFLFTNIKPFLSFYFLPLSSACAVIIFNFFRRGKEEIDELKIFSGLLPSIFFSFFINNSHYGIPFLPLPMLKDSGWFGPFPVFIFLLLTIFTGKTFERILILLCALGAISFRFYPFILTSLLFLIISSSKKFELEIIKGEGRVFSQTMRWIWKGIKYGIFIFIIAWLLGEKKLYLNLLYILSSLLLIEIGFIFKSATILIRHKVYFAGAGFLLSSLLSIFF